MNANFKDLLHSFDNGDKGNCAVFQEFLVPTVNPRVDGYDLRGLQCRCVYVCALIVPSHALTRPHSHVIPVQA